MSFGTFNPRVPGKYNANNATSLSVNIQTFTSSGTYVPSLNMIYCEVEVVGGGGAGGGIAITNSGGNKIAVSGGGGAGEYAKGIFTAAQIGASQAITIGNAGAAITDNNPGGNGGTSSFGSLITCAGGSGGDGAPANATAQSATGGIGGAGGTGGSFRSAGAPGGSSTAQYGSATQELGNGAPSYFGGGANRTTATGDGNDAKGYGSGGSGCFAAADGSTHKGGAGAKGIVVVTEYIAQTGSTSGNIYTASVTPAFGYRLASSTGAVTGDGTAYTVLPATKLYDTTSSFNTATGIFTAPITGQYQLNAMVLMQNVTSSMTAGLIIVTTARDWAHSNFATSNETGNMPLSFSVLADMNAGDTAKMQVNFGNGSKVATVYGGGDARTAFSGFLISPASGNYLSNGIIPVINGGTSNNSQTPYSLVAGGTTSTGPFQAVGPNAATNALLLSQGSSALPIFTTTGTPAVTGIKFASADTLSTYNDNATSTPGFAGSTGAGSPSFTLNEGRWNRIGNVVFFRYVVIGTMSGSPSGAAIISLPVNPPFGSRNFMGATICQVGGAWYTALLQAASGGLQFTQYNGSTVAVGNGDFNLQGTLVYFV